MKHVHQYVRVAGSKKQFRCDHPHCYHRIDLKYIVGKASICNKCGNEFILTREDLRRAKPVCLECSDTEKARQHRKAKEILAQLQTELQESQEFQL